MKKSIQSMIVVFALLASVETIAQVRTVVNFNENWQFIINDTSSTIPSSETNWRTIDLPHDWSIEGDFSEEHPATVGGGALPAGVGWYKKQFIVPGEWKTKKVWIEFDGVYRNSEVWINGNYIGKRPYGYSSFRYEISSFLKYNGEYNSIVVRVDNSK